MNLQTIAVLGFCMWLQLLSTANGNAVFQVENKFKGKNWTLHDLREHDTRRHGRMLDTMDLPLGGTANAAILGLYYTKIKLGTPPTDFHVQVDTGSDILWVNCAGCKNCPTETGLKIELNLFNYNKSSTAKVIGCGDEACGMIYSGVLEGCQPNISCMFRLTYGDQSSIGGYFVEDTLSYNKAASGNQKEPEGKGSVVFGCGDEQGGTVSTKAEALDGIMGFGQSNSSVLSQLSAGKKVKNIFSHCLDKEGGGIFAIGELVEPEVSMTAIIPNQTHYNVLLKSVQVGNEITDLSKKESSAIIDSGTTLAYVPDYIYEQFMSAINSSKPDLNFWIKQSQYNCFQYGDKVDDAFPVIKFHFTKSLDFTLRPSEYLFRPRKVDGEEDDENWCIGWMNSGGQSVDGKEIFLLGDLVLSNKLVVYDLDKQALGWTDYNCSSSIKLRDGVKGSVEDVDAHNIGVSGSLAVSPPTVSVVASTILVVLVLMMIQFTHHH